MQILSEHWVLAPDPGNAGRKERWFASGPAPDARPATVPGIIQMVFPDYHGVAWYWCRFTPALAAGPHMRWQIHFEGFVDYLGEAWLNGHSLGSYEGGEGSFDFDATAALLPGRENMLAVRVLNPTNEPIDGYILKEVPHRNKVMPHTPGSGFDYGGIMLPVELRTVLPLRVTDAFVRPDPRSGQVPVTIALRNDTSAAVECTLTASIGPSLRHGTAAQTFQRTSIVAGPGDSAASVTLRVDDPHPWNLDDPYLYCVSLRLEATLKGNPMTDEYAVRCGFRELRVERGYFRLNGRRIFLRSTHTGNHVPFGQCAPVIPDLVRRDAINAKAAGFNMVRFICGMAWPEQLDFFDEVGLLVYEECMASWCLADSPRMAERFDRSTDAMILRDRNHPSVAIWGLLNETRDGPVYRHAVQYLARLRMLDGTRLALLSSGRWDGQWDTGSVSNPGSTVWEHSWGAEAPGAPPAPALEAGWKTDSPGGYVIGAGDAHIYLPTPQIPRNNHLLRTVGHDTRPVFLSEYGVGSLFNVIRETRCFEQAGVRSDLFDVALVRRWADRVVADWTRWGFDGTYACPEDMLTDSQRLHSRQRQMGFDLVRSNPRICGFNVTGMLDHGMTGEGLWTFNREWKPGIVDVLSDGWAPVRWCLFVEPMHGYTGRAIHVEAVLANEDVLRPGSYPVTFRISGPRGVAWEKRGELRLPEPAAGGDGPLAVPALSADVEIGGPAGMYQLRAYMERGGAPAGGTLRFCLSDPSALPAIRVPVTTWGIDTRTEKWLRERGAEPRAFARPAPARREVILVGVPGRDESDLARWADLARRMTQGSHVIFLSPEAFARGEDPVGWLPLAVKGRCYRFHDWLYHKECVAKDHPLFAGLQANGIMDWEHYGPVIPHHLFDGQPVPDEVVAAAFAVSTTTVEGYASGVLLGVYRFGAGGFTVNSMPILENVDRHPAADRLLVNLVREAAKSVDGPPATAPADFDARLAAIGYR